MARQISGCAVAGFWIAGGLFASVVFLGTVGPLLVKAAPASCSSNWALCADNAEIERSYDGWSKARSECKYATEDRVKYGSPEWPWITFSTYLTGDSYRKTGKATLIEPDAKLANGFGAMVRSRVTCEYDLGARKVTDISIAPR